MQCFAQQSEDNLKLFISYTYRTVKHQTSVLSIGIILLIMECNATLLQVIPSDTTQRMYIKIPPRTIACNYYFELRYLKYEFAFNQIKLIGIMIRNVLNYLGKLRLALNRVK